MKHNYLFCALILFVSCTSEGKRNQANVVIPKDTINSNGQDKISYHNCRITDPGDFIVEKWNAPKDSLSRAYIKETSDSKGRVIELKFLLDNSFDYTVECGGCKWLKYEYPNDSTIIEYTLDEQGKQVVEFFCDVPYKTIYHLSKDQKLVLGIENKFLVDTAFYLKLGKSLKELDAELQKAEMDKSPSIVSSYIKSFNKLNGIFPVTKDFKLNNYGQSDEEMKLLEKSLNNN